MREDDSFRKIGKTYEGDKPFACCRRTVTQQEFLSTEIQSGSGIRKKCMVALPAFEGGGCTGITVLTIIVALILDAIVEVDGVQVMFFVITQLFSTADDLSLIHISEPTRPY